MSDEPNKPVDKNAIGHNKKLYRLYCQLCHWSKLTDGSDIKDLYEVKMSPIQKGIPKLDPTTSETIISKDKKQPKRFRCPKCGRPVVPKKMSGVEKPKPINPESVNE